MHELSVTENILEIAVRHAREADAARINHIYLVIGELTSIVDDSVQFYWDIIAKDTPADGAKLHFQRIPVRVQCLDCQCEFNPGGDQFECPDCGRLRLQVVAGKEFFVEAIEVDN